MNAPTEFDRKQWLTERKMRLGATDVSAILGVSPYSSPWDVWADKTNQLSDWDGNDATRAGQFVERSVLDYAESQLGPLERNKVVHHPTLPVASTLDGRVIATGYPVEAKTSGLCGPIVGTWGEPDSEEVPEYYAVQVNTQLLCTDAEIAYLYALLPYRGFVRYIFERNKERLDSLASVIDAWWTTHILRGVEPDRSTASLDAVKRIIKGPSKSIDLGDDVYRVVQQRKLLKDQAKTIGDKIEQCDAIILASLGDADHARLPGGYEVTHNLIRRKGFEVKPCEYRKLNVKEPK